MNFTATLIGQSLAFLIFVGLCMKFVWPPIMKALQERRQKIEEGLEAANQATLDLERVKEESEKYLAQARKEAALIVEQGKKRALDLIEEAKGQARLEAFRVKESAKGEVALAKEKAREELRGEVSKLALMGAEKILSRSIDASTHQDLLKQLSSEL